MGRGAHWGLGMGPLEGASSRTILVVQTRMMEKYKPRAALFSSSAMQTSALQCSPLSHLLYTQTLQWHPGSNTQRMRSEYSIKFPTAGGREPWTKHNREGSLGMPKEREETRSLWSARYHAAGKLGNQPGPFPWTFQHWVRLLSVWFGHH